MTAALVALATGLLAISPQALLVMLPALLLAWVVLLGWFTGERAIALVRRTLRRQPARSRPRTREPLRRPPRSIVRGGLLLACSLASRPPPHPA
jgi:hypothetical protein